MGFEIHITRAIRWPESERFPILGHEVEALVAGEPDLTIPPDAPRRADFCYVAWRSGIPKWEHHLLFREGRLSIKHPELEFVRRMLELGERLDAWVISDDDQPYRWDGAEVVVWERDPAAFAQRQLFLTRGRRWGGDNKHAPILPDEWAALVAAQRDFTLLTSVEAALPSGTRSLAVPAIAGWTGHPSGRPVPFSFDEDVIEVRDADEHTERRMVDLATGLAARLVDGEESSPPWPPSATPCRPRRPSRPP
ncbi:hypothetical protein AB0J83_29715 [Actinoplanes sp. NPDC049596]|uniref:hypothetical protein n=1 Tax=unclassified Actinoplanes TaxID=2626549 RepID=UPI0034378867